MSGSFHDFLLQLMELQLHSVSVAITTDALLPKLCVDYHITSFFMHVFAVLVLTKTQTILTSVVFVFMKMLCRTYTVCTG